MEAATQASASEGFEARQASAVTRPIGLHVHMKHVTKVLTLSRIRAREIKPTLQSTQKEARARRATRYHHNDHIHVHVVYMYIVLYMR